VILPPLVFPGKRYKPRRSDKPEEERAGKSQEPTSSLEGKGSVAGSILTVWPVMQTQKVLDQDLNR
jgi:hypothetical protein